MATEFHRLGYLVIERALNAEELARLNAAVDRHWRDFPDKWTSLSDSFCEGTNILPDTGATANAPGTVRTSPRSSSHSDETGIHAMSAVPMTQLKKV